MPPTPVWAKPSFVAHVIIAYCAIHFAVRMAMWPTLGVDDAEQALFAQDFAWSYRYQAPPLFTWLLLALGRVVGVDLVSISLVRYALLGATFAFAYLTARRVIADPQLAALSLYSFAAIYIFAYYSHHDLTHTTALSAGLALAWYVFLRLAETPSLAWYAALGAVFGLGLLGKWNFVMFAAALPLACLLSQPWRRLVISPKILVAGLVCAAIVLPTVAAAIRLGPAPGDNLRSVLGVGAEGALTRIVEGLAELLKALIVFPQPLLVLLIAVFAAPLWRGICASPRLDGRASVVRLIGWTMAISVALHALLVVAGATEISERLMQPALLILPVFLFALVERGRPSARAVHAFAALLFVLALGTLAARIGLYLRGADDCRSCRAMVPFGELAAKLRDAGFSGEGTILVEDFHIGGNARIAFPDARIIDTGYPLETWPETAGGGQCLLLWRGSADGEQEPAPAAEQAYLAASLNGQADAPHRDGAVAGLMFGSATREYPLAVPAL